MDATLEPEGVNLNLLPPDHLARIDLHLRNLLERTFQADGLIGFNQTVRAYVLCGGKRVRPQLCLWTWMNSAEVPTTEVPASEPAALLELACTWELFHAFLLAHDDIIDSAEHRRGQPSLHRQLAALDGDCPRFGANLGIVAGDLLFSAALRICHELDLPADRHREVLRLFSRIACQTGFGQAVDILYSHARPDEASEEELLREYHWKTAAYTFEGPMLSGALLAGACAEARAAIARFALALGQAYQLQNDLIDLSRPAAEGCDLMEGKRTVTLRRARAAMSDLQRLRFDRRLRKLKRPDAQSLALAESLRQEVWSLGAPQRTFELIRRLLDEAHHAASDPAIPERLGRGMVELLRSLDGQYFVLAPPVFPEPGDQVASTLGISRSSTFALHSTPGIPAPGCVPAPTK